MSTVSHDLGPNHPKAILQGLLKRHLAKLRTKVDVESTSLILLSINEEVFKNEGPLVKKLRAAQSSMNTKLQREIANFINLKVKIALYKNGISLSEDFIA